MAVTVRARTGFCIFQHPSASSMASRAISRPRQVGTSSRFWRLMSRKSGSRIWRATPVHFMRCRRRRAPTWSDSWTIPAWISARPCRLRAKVLPLPTDLGGVYCPAGATGDRSRPQA